MKILNKLFSVLTIVLSVAALVLFFTDFGKVIFADGTEVVRAGTEFAFGSDYNGADIGKSSDLLFCMLLTAFTILFAALSLKFKKTRWAAVGFSFVDAIYMLVVALSGSNHYLDTQGFANAVDTEYVNNTALLIAVALILTFASSVAYLLISDRIASAASGNPTIPKRVVKFLRDYKGEIKKIVWPGPRSVVKNTVIVLIICLIFGAFIWLIDFGLGELLDLVFKSKSA